MSLLALLPWQTSALTQALGQIQGNAVLVHGAHGAGQLPLALSLARAWLCEAHTDSGVQGAIGSGATQAACGACAGCHLVEQGHHPDLKVIVPEDMQANLGWAHMQDADDHDSGEGKKKKPSREIKVEAIRQVLAFCQNTVSRGRAKVVVIHPAQRMNTVAANTLLKTLEEPPGHVRFVLTCDNLDELMPTIRSRCQPWQLPSPEGDTAVAWIQAQANQGGMKLSPDDALVLLGAAGGSPLAAIELLQLGWTPAMWQQVPTDLAKGHAGPWAQWPLPEVVSVQQKLCHDLSCMQVGAMPRYFPTKALAALLPKSLPRMAAWDAELRLAQRHAEHPWSAGLKLQSLMLRAQQALG